MEQLTNIPRYSTLHAIALCEVEYKKMDITLNEAVTLSFIWETFGKVILKSIDQYFVNINVCMKAKYNLPSILKMIHWFVVVHLIPQIMYQRFCLEYDKM